ncbi:hypothetical protein GCM10010329_71060 [Streptomyces spiroverticillatus]|uniref:Superoxide dismutase n=1 Tax=Streptomyces finlayi TaxID=67296 RepID=A0A918X0J6_9ACTN|nr:superoxide dismutase [Streptomyces finlayi]GHA37582.1 hypothetical protein GCM10010329_71060 [Streptomyces spiroverticillatus]GHD01275.1 hypothetical protein GCM10010334_46750 [Streptomyces finlayi]
MSDSLTRRRLLTAGAALGGAALMSPLAGTAHAAAGPGSWPTRFPLPNGFQPEGIAIGHRPYAYFGSLVDGSVRRVELATGKGSTAVKGLGNPTVGLKIDTGGRLFLAGGLSKQIRIADSRTGKHLAVYDLPQAEMVNDVVLRPGIAWFTDSYRAQVYGVPLGRHGELPAARDLITRKLTGDWNQGVDFAANGLSHTPDGRALLVSDIPADGGSLMRVDPRTGEARKVDLGALKLPDADGLLLLGNLLYVVQQMQNAIDVIRLNPAGTRGAAVTRITDPRFRIPTTVAAWGNRLYLPNARFDVEPKPDTEYDVVSVRTV